MTLQQARQIFFINIEIKRLKADIDRLDSERTYYHSPLITGMPRGGEHESASDRYLDRQIRLHRQYSRKLEELQDAIAEFEDFLTDVEDSEMRVILRMRCVNNLTWEEIGAEMHMERTTVAKKFYRFFENSHNSR